MLKKILFVSTMLSFSLAATKIYWENSSTHEQGESFSDSSFDYYNSAHSISAKKFCFVGQAKDVCPMINQYADRMKSIYANGAHDTINILSCTLNNDVVTGHYSLRDDYRTNDLDVTRVIAACAKVQP